MELIKVNSASKYPVSGRELHERLGIESKYADWFKRMKEYGFEELKDYQEVFLKNEKNPSGGRPTINHELSLAMAKEICMLQRTEQGRAVRRYLIEVEESWNNPDAIMERALRIAHERVQALQNKVIALNEKNDELTEENKIMAPKAEYFDELVDRHLLTNFRTTAKELKVGERDFISYLLEHQYVYRSPKGSLLPHSAHTDDGLFEVKETASDKTGWAGTQTLITPKGRETFRLLMKKHGKKRGKA